MKEDDERLAHVYQRYEDFSWDELIEALEKENGHAGRAGIRLDRKRELIEKERGQATEGSDFTAGEAVRAAAASAAAVGAVASTITVYHDISRAAAGKAPAVVGETNLSVGKANAARTSMVTVCQLHGHRAHGRAPSAQRTHSSPLFFRSWRRNHRPQP